MGDVATTTSRRAGRSTETSRRLERARKHNLEQLAEQREREKRVDEALRAFIGAEDRITAADQAYTAKVADYEDKIAKARQERDGKVSGERTEQARAALAIHEAGRTVEQVGGLLEVSQKEARRLIAAGRQAPPKPARRRPDTTSSAVADRERDVRPPDAVSGSEQGDLGGVDAHQDGPDPSLVPTVAHGGTQRA